MLGPVVVDRRIPVRHPELTCSDVATAWREAFVVQERCGDSACKWVALGCDPRGRMLEMLAVELQDGRTLIYHAFTPPTRKFLNEIGLG
jgi:hypothetical protein